MGRHGFETNSQVQDDELLMVDKDIIASAMETYSYQWYMRHKAKLLKNVIALTVENNDGSLEAQSRLTYRLKALKYTEKVLEYYVSKR